MGKGYEGVFISLEGGEYGGKSTVAKSVLAVATEYGVFDCILTREPGGSKRAERIRDNLKLGKPDGMSDEFWWEYEAGVFYTAGGYSVEDVLRPQLSSPLSVVISDRWRDSTWAYQGEMGAGHCSPEYLQYLHDTHIGSFAPTMTIYFEIDEETFLQRQANVQAHGARSQDGLARYDEQKMEFHRKIWAGYEARMKMDPERFWIVDARQSPDHLFADVWGLIIEHLFEQGYFKHGENKTQLINAGFNFADSLAMGLLRRQDEVWQPPRRPVVVSETTVLENRLLLTAEAYEREMREP